MVNPFLLQDGVYTQTPEVEIPKSNLNVPTINPFDILITDKQDVSKQIEDSLPDLNTLWKPDDKTAPITVSTKFSEDYIRKGFNVNDLDLNPKLEQDLSSTQSRADRLLNNLKVAGANFISMAVATGFSNPLSTGTEDLEAGIAKDLFDWSSGIAKDSRNYETKDDSSDDIWTNLNNWINPFSNSTKGYGKILESTAFGLGAGAGIAFQEGLATILTDGIGTVPMLAKNIQKLLNSAKYLDQALEVSGIAVKGANNLQKVVRAGEVSNQIAKGLQTAYRSQLGAYSEALFEGLEGKENLKDNLIKDFEKYNGYTPTGKELDKIEQISSNAGLARLNVNRALLSLSNISQYNSIFKSYDAFREGAEAMAEKYGSKIAFEEGKAVVKKDARDKLFKGDWFNKGIGKGIDVVATGVYNTVKKEAVKEGLQEGYEEGMQFLIDKSINNYYTWKYKGQNKNILNAIEEGTKEIFSKEGLESIFTGMLSGAGQSVVTNLFSNLNKEYKASKIKYNENQEELAKQYNKLGQRFNSIPLETRKQLSNIFNNNSVRGTLTEQIINANASAQLADMKSNAEDSEQFNQLLTQEVFNLALPYIKNGNIDILKEQFQEYSKLDNNAFQKMFGIEASNKQDLINYYQDEFNKIQKAYNQVNNSFQDNFKGDNISRVLYNEMKNEIAFSLYNHTKLIEDSKSLESRLGEYKDILNNYANNLPKAFKDNESKIKELEQELQINDSIEVKQRIKGLQDMNEYIDSILNKEKAKNISKQDYLKTLKKNIIDPYFKQKNQLIPDEFQEIENLNEKLQSVYYLAKIKDRINYQQDKLNKLLYTDKPEEFFKNSQREFEELIFSQIKQEEKPVEVIKPKDTNPLVFDEEDELPTKQRLVDLSDLNLDKLLQNKTLEDLEKEYELSDEDKVTINDFLFRKEQETLLDTNGLENISSKQSPLVYIVDDEGNVLTEDKDILSRVTLMNKLSNGEITTDELYSKLEYNYVALKSRISNLLVTIDGNKYIKMSDEKALYKKEPSKGISIKYEGNPIAFIPLDDLLYVDINLIKGIKGVNLISYNEALDVIEKDTTGKLFKKANEIDKNGIAVLFNNTSPINTFRNNYNQFKNTIDNLDSFVDNNTLNTEELSKYITDNNLLDYTAFIDVNNQKKEKQVLSQTSLKDNPIIELLKYGDDYSVIIESGLDYVRGDVNKINSFKQEVIEYFKTRELEDGNYKYVWVKQKHVRGTTSYFPIDIKIQSVKEYPDFNTSILNTEDEIRDYVNAMFLSLKGKYNDNTFSKIKDSSIRVYPEGNRIKVKTTIDLDNTQIKSEVIVDKGITQKDLYDSIINSIKDIQGLETDFIELYKTGKDSKDTLSNRNLILIPTYSKYPSSIFTTAYFRIKSSNVSIVKPKKVVDEPVDISNLDQILSNLSEEDKIAELDVYVGSVLGDKDLFDKTYKYSGNLKEDINQAFDRYNNKQQEYNKVEIEKPIQSKSNDTEIEDIERRKIERRRQKELSNNLTEQQLDFLIRDTKKVNGYIQRTGGSAVGERQSYFSFSKKVYKEKENLFDTINAKYDALASLENKKSKETISKPEETTPVVEENPRLKAFIEYLNNNGFDLAEAVKQAILSSPDGIDVELDNLQELLGSGNLMQLTSDILNKNTIEDGIFVKIQKPSESKLRVTYNLESIKELIKNCRQG